MTKRNAKKYLFFLGTIIAIAGIAVMAVASDDSFGETIKLSTNEMRIDDNTSYVNGDPDYLTSYVEFYLESNGQVTKSEYGGKVAYGADGSYFNIRMKLTKSATMYEEIASGHYLSDDSYNGLVDGTDIHGTVHSGALIVLISTNGSNWTSISTGDFMGCMGGYNKDGWVIYTGNGSDLKNGGIYVKLKYAYETYHDEWVKSGYKFLGFLWWVDTSHNERRYDNHLVSTDIFMMTMDNPKAVSYHNLMLANMDYEQFGEYAEAYRVSETLRSGDVVTEGFEIECVDRTLQCTVWHNDKCVVNDKNISNMKFTSPGCYKIKTRTLCGSTDDITIYVVGKDSYTLMNNLIGNERFVGESTRVLGDFTIDFSDNSVKDVSRYPTFVLEGFKWELPKMKAFDGIPYTAMLSNLTTGSVATVHYGDSGLLTEEGLYHFDLTAGNSNSGDTVNIRLYFAVVEDQIGRKTVNQTLLEHYNGSSFIDTDLQYYGVTFESSGKGNVILAYSDEASAIAYAREYLTRSVQTHGVEFWYKDQLWTDPYALTLKIEQDARCMVSQRFFVPNEVPTILTLDDSDIDIGNLKRMELDMTVILFASEREKALLVSKNSSTIFCQKPVALLKDGEVETSVSDFQFISVPYDVLSVEIVSDGTTYQVPFNTGVAGYLKEMGCSAGPVTVREKYATWTIEYPAVFIGDVVDVHVDIGYFSEPTMVGDVEFLPDDATVLASSCYDECVLAIVVKDRVDHLRTIVKAKDLQMLPLGPGHYDIKFVNRAGASRIVSFDVEDLYEIKFMDGTDVVSRQFLKDGQMPVLPNCVPVRAPTDEYVFEFVGWNVTAADADRTYVPIFVEHACKYTITYVLFEGNTVEEVHAYGERIVPMEAPSSALRFCRWTNIPDTMPAHDVEVTAIWYQLPEEVEGLMRIISDESLARFLADATEITISGTTDGSAWSLTVPKSFFEKGDLVDVRIEEASDGLYSLSMSVNGVDTHQFDQEVLVKLPYSIPEGCSAEDVHVYYVHDDGTLEEYACEYAEGSVSFRTDHFSSWKIEAEGHEEHSGSLNAYVSIGILAALSVAAGIIVLRRRV